ncbi:unnamed protein product [Staurois parvus]|uniref:Uncharacterized protein n=1 Tax=Staurois parvus TaxID=386267 RepID=A0ABN9AHD7_9NEOB|nr:unnamed protein product [Staurois parvus]CAI9613457.1 unnamed protein product [Staurois parvus]CAI9618758.1 unnamed protein product [Staurois parvus]
MGDQSRRMVRQSQGSEQENGQTKPGIRAGSATNQTGTGTGLQEQDTGPRKNTHQGRVCRSGHPLNTPA